MRATKNATKPQLFFISFGCLALLIASGAQAQYAEPADALARLDPNRYPAATLIQAIEVLESYKPPQAVALAQTLLSHPDSQVARAAAWLLRRMERGPDGVNTAAAVLQDPNSSVQARRSSACALGVLKEESGRNALSAALSQDTDEQVRINAALSLGDLHRRGCAGFLVATLLNDINASVRAAAARALGDAPDADSASLVAALGDASPLVRKEAAWALGRHGFLGVSGNLLGVLQADVDCQVQAAAAWALPRLKDAGDSVREALRVASVGPCRLSAQAAALGLSEMEGK